MDRDYVQHLFIIERAIGIGVDGSVNQEENLFPNYICTVVFLTLSVFDIVYIINRGFFTNDPIYYFSPLLVHRLVRGVFATYTLSMGLYHYKKKVKVACQLHAVQDQLKHLNHATHKVQWEKVFMNFCVFIYMIHLMETIVFVVSTYMYNEGLTAVDIFMDFYYDIIKCLVFCECTVLTMRFLRNQKQINDALEHISPRSSEGISSVVTTVERRVAWAETEALLQEKVVLLESIQILMSSCEKDLQSCYLVFVNWIAFATAVSMPSLCLLIIFDISWHTIATSITMATYLVIVLVVATAQSQYYMAKEATIERLSKLLTSSASGDSKRRVRRSVRAATHRCAQLDCYFFDLDFDIIVAVLENIAMVACTILSDTK